MILGRPVPSSEETRCWGLVTPVSGLRSSCCSFGFGLGAVGLPFLSGQVVPRGGPWLPMASRPGGSGVGGRELVLWALSFPAQWLLVAIRNYQTVL